MFGAAVVVIYRCWSVGMVKVNPAQSNGENLVLHDSVFDANMA